MMTGPVELTVDPAKEVADPWNDRYARLLVEYCLSLEPGQKLLIRSTLLAEPLVREVCKHAWRTGAHVEVQLDFQGQNALFFQEATGDQLRYLSVMTEQAFRHFDAYLYIRAPYNLFEDQGLDADKLAIRQEAAREINQVYAERTANRSLKRNLCQYPTDAAAQMAGMSLTDYRKFVYNACKLDADDPVAAWLEVRRMQQGVVDVLNKATHVHYKGPDIDIQFQTQGRVWINSDGQTNMPSGEVYTSPVEDSVEGMVRFSLPALYMGHELEGVTLWVEKGEVVKWEASRGQDFLDKVFQMPGAKRFGEAAIGTNYGINRFTKNILFDEKIGGTIHLALGQSYLQTGGKNESAVHWDLITDMTQGGAIFADGEKIYENGHFLTGFTV